MLYYYKISNNINIRVQYSIMESTDINESIHAVRELYEKYREEPYMIQRMSQYIKVQLPTIMESFHNNHIQRNIRNQELISNQEIFIENFFNRFKNYYYCVNTEKFFYYDQKNYLLIIEDDIIHHILRTITESGTISAWKQRTKVTIMKRIKENNILKTIPNSDTIQQVIDLFYPTVFQTKNEAKYFLTILGDNIQKKHLNLIHFIDPKLKSFIRELNNYIHIYVSGQCSQTIKYKYHEHDYSLCRVLNCNEISTNFQNQGLEQSLNILCVASHYSTRYDSSDDYLERMNNDVLKNEILFLKNTSPDDLISKFLNQYIQINNSIDENNGQQILWKNILYLWRHFLNHLKIPSVIFQQVLKSKIIERLHDNYDEINDSFKNISSKWLPKIQKFITFWNENMEHDEFETDLEIEEVMLIYKKWLNDQSIQINEKQVFDILQYYFPDVETESEKFINKIRCKLWDKNLDIQICLENIRELMMSKQSSSPEIYSQTTISIYEIYQKYCKIQYTSQKMIVSKNYFEKYVYENLTQYIVNNNMISLEWIHY